MSLNLPNILTLSRFVLTIGFIMALNHPGPGFVTLAIALFAIAAITDFLDGYLAKTRNLISNFGKIMDPIADKFLILSAFFIFMRMHLIAPWMFYIVLGRELVVTCTRLAAAYSGTVIAAEKAGKYKTVLQIVAVFFVLLYLLFSEVNVSATWFPTFVQYWQMAATVIMMLAVGLTLGSGILYFWNNRKSFSFSRPR